MFSVVVSCIVYRHSNPVGTHIFEGFTHFFDNHIFGGLIPQNTLIFGGGRTPKPVIRAAYEYSTKLPRST